MDFSVIICTYNRADSLSRTLESLRTALVHVNERGEIIVVDNNSGDHTFQVVDKFRSHLPLTYLLEPRQGKGLALNKGVKKAAGNLLIFTDDDVTFDSEWLKHHLIAAERQPYDWFGNPIYPRWPADAPRWFINSDNKKHFSGYLVWYEIDGISRPYTGDDMLPWGASMAIRLEPIKRVGRFREDIGPKGERRGKGEDVDMIERLIRTGYRGYYVHEAVCYHHLNPERLRHNAFFRYGFSRGIDDFRINKLPLDGSIPKAGLYLIKSLHQFLKRRDDNVRINLMNAGNQLGRVYARRAHNKGASTTAQS